ncbi:MAG TPA: DUF309 domain-containing protein [Geobacteraceae bacterium]|nr:DUF309 domain-containing protein [Geobacteraceae bacterium]
MTQECEDIPSAELLRAVDEFNRGDWYDCHDTLEELCVGEKGVLRDFYQGILQVAVALHHWRNGNFRGAVILLEKGVGLLRRVPPVYKDVDIDGLAIASERMHEALNTLGAERMGELDPGLIPRLRLLHCLR